MSQIILKVDDDFELETILKKGEEFMPVKQIPYSKRTEVDLRGKFIKGVITLTKRG